MIHLLKLDSITTCNDFYWGGKIYNQSNENRLDVNLFPNPASKTLNVEGDFERIEIFNLIGELVISTSSSTIDVSALESGIYYSHILKDQDILIKQITITK